VSVVGEDCAGRNGKMSIVGNARILAVAVGKMRRQKRGLNWN